MNAQQTAIEFALDNELDNFRLIMEVAKDRPLLFKSICDIDFDALVVKLLKQDPDYFLQLAKTQVTGMTKLGAIKERMLAGDLVGAIKNLRIDTGLGLKEAKDVIVSARAALVAAGKLPAPASSPHSSVLLSSRDQQYADAIFASF